MFDYALIDNRLLGLLLRHRIKNAVRREPCPSRASLLTTGHGEAILLSHDGSAGCPPLPPRSCHDEAEVDQAAAAREDVLRRLPAAAGEQGRALLLLPHPLASRRATSSSRRRAGGDTGSVSLRLRQIRCHPPSLCVLADMWFR